MTLSSLPKVSRNEKYRSTIWSFWEKRCSIEKSILMFGINKDQNSVIPATRIRVFLGYLRMIRKKVFNMIEFR
jgi:hypothetical protein